MPEVHKQNLKQTEHEFDGRPVYKKESKSRKGNLLYAEKECENCGDSYLVSLRNIVNNKSKACSESCGIAISSGHEDAESQYKGVHKRIDGKAWQAQIRKDGETYYLGSTFDTEEEAARAYDRKALELYENPYTNFRKSEYEKG